MVVTKLPAQRAADGEARHDWWRSAACREADPELFFPVAPVGPGAGEIAAAKELCATCGVRRQCLQYALATHQLHGVWGGLTEAERVIHVRREREREHRERDRGQRQRRDPVRPEGGEPAWNGNGTRARGGLDRIRSV
jgi:WhiB family redox-sensing transcriptional regulator